MSEFKPARNADDELFEDLNSHEVEQSSTLAAVESGGTPMAEILDNAQSSTTIAGSPASVPMQPQAVAAGISLPASGPAFEPDLIRVSGFSSEESPEPEKSNNAANQAALTEQERLRKAYLEAQFWADSTSRYLRPIEKGGMCRDIKRIGDVLFFEVGSKVSKSGEIIFDGRTGDLFVKGRDMNPQMTAAAMVEMGQKLGWKVMTFEGKPEFIREAMELAKQAGISVVDRNTFEAIKANANKPDRPKVDPEVNAQLWAEQDPSPSM